MRLLNSVLFSFLCCAVSGFTLWGCAGAAGTGLSNNSPAKTGPNSSSLVITGLSPSKVTQGQPNFVLNVAGKDFGVHSAILWNGSPLPTTYLTPSEVAATVASSDTGQPGTISIAVKDNSSGLLSNSLPLTVSATQTKALQILTTSLPQGQQGQPYFASLSASGGVPPYQWKVVSGTLPDGLSLSAGSGTITGSAANTGSFPFTVLATDSAAQPSTTLSSLSINVISPLSVSSTTSSQSYGPALGADALANTVVGGPYSNEVSYRFRAEHSGILQTIHLYFIPDHAGYAAGTGGKIQVKLTTDDGSSAHNPSSTTLATYEISDPLADASMERYFPVLTFQNPPTLTAGQLYHIVFSNVDSNSSTNYLSVDDLYQQNSPTPTQPFLNDLNWGVLLRYNGGKWALRKGFTPILELDYKDGWSSGVGYIEAWIGSPQEVSGSYAVREAFTPTGAPRKVGSVAIRVARILGAGPLKVRLESAEGTLVEQGEISASSIPLTNPFSYVWAKYNFSSPHTLVPGQAYHLVLEATSTSVYQVFPIRKGSAYGFRDTTYFPDGFAQFKQGTTWVGWTEWGSTNRTDADLQFYFGLVP